MDANIVKGFGSWNFIWKGIWSFWERLEYGHSISYGISTFLMLLFSVALQWLLGYNMNKVGIGFRVASAMLGTKRGKKSEMMVSLASLFLFCFSWYSGSSTFEEE